MPLTFQKVPREVLERTATRDVHYDDSDYIAAVEYAMTDPDGDGNYSCQFDIPVSDGEKRTKQRVTKALHKLKINKVIKWRKTVQNGEGEDATLTLSFQLNDPRPEGAPRRGRKPGSKNRPKELVTV